MEKAVLPFNPYPLLRMESEVSMAFSKAHVTSIDSILNPARMRLKRLPSETSLPMDF